MFERLHSVVPSDWVVECDYCGETFWGESRHDAHLRETHGDELGPLERRNLTDSSDDTWTNGLAVLGGLLAVPTLLLVYLLVAGGGGSAAPADTVHTHGSISVTIDGQQVDFSRSEYQLQDDRFHFEGGEGDRWHGHASGVTLAAGMATLGIDVSQSAVTFQDETYRESDGWRVVVQVNDQPVTPSEYVLTDGDSIRILVERD